MGNVGSIQTAKGEMFTNAHVLSQSRASLGYFVLSGCDVNQSGTPGMSVVVDSGYIQVGWGTTQKTVAGGTVVITAAHPTLPRMDTIYIDSNGTVRVYDGTATAISPSDKTNFKQMSTPAPGTNIPNGVIIALVYVAAGDTSITNAEILDIATYGPLVTEAPTTTTAGKIPYWSSTAKTLSDGYNVGTTANCLLQLDSSARIPAVSGSLLTSISHGNLTNLLTDDHTQYIKHALATSSSDFLVSSSSGAFIKKTLAETKTVLGLGSAAYTASTDYAPAAQGVTNGNSHDHSGGDGASLASQFVSIGADISLGARLGAHIYILDNGAGIRWGIGARINELQSFIRAADHFSWNAGGDLQESGTNELMRLTGDGNLGIGCVPLAKQHVRGSGLGIYGGLLIDNVTSVGKWGIVTGTDDALWLMSSDGVIITFDPTTGALTGAKIAYSDVSGTPNPSDYAPAAKGVTNGDSHDHSGGDGAQIAYTSLSGTPTRKWGGSFVFGDGSAVILAQEMGIGPFPVACTITEVKIREQALISSSATITLHIHDYNAAIGTAVDTFTLGGSTYSETGLSWSVAANKWVTIKVASPVSACQLAVGLVFEAA